MTVNEIYECLKYYHLDDDTQQEIALKIWANRDAFDESRGKLSTFISTIVKHHKISQWRSAEYKKDEVTRPISDYEMTTDDGTLDCTIDRFLTSKELTPDDDLIRQEEKDMLLERINELPDMYSEILKAYISGEYDPASVTERARLHRAKKALVEQKEKKSYLLVNLKSNQQHHVNSFDEAATIVGCHTETCRLSYISGRKFKKDWRISGK